jgi:hypothetical protein
MGKLLGGALEKNIYWKNDQVNVLLEKKSFNAMIVPIAEGTDEEVMDIYIDELRSVLSFSKKGNLYYLVGVSDSWFDDESANGYFEEKNNNSKKAIMHEFHIPKASFDVLGQKIFTKEKCEKIINLFNDSILTTERMKFIKGQMEGDNNVENVDIKIGSFWNDYPCIYYTIKGLRYYGWIVFDPETNKMIFTHLLSEEYGADKLHSEHIFQMVNERGTVFKVENGKLICGLK